MSEVWAVPLQPFFEHTGTESIEYYPARDTFRLRGIGRCKDITRRELKNMKFYDQDSEIQARYLCDWYQAHRNNFTYHTQFAGTAYAPVLPVTPNRRTKLLLLGDTK